MGDQPIRRSERTSWAENPEGIPTQGFLVGDVHVRILREHHVELLIGERERPRSDHPDFDATLEPPTFDSSARLLAQCGFDINANDLDRAGSRAHELGHDGERHRHPAETRIWTALIEIARSWLGSLTIGSRYIILRA